MLQQGVHGFRIEGIERDRGTARHFIGDGRAQETDGRADARTHRHDDGFDADLFGKPAGMQGCAAAEGDHGAGGDVAAALDGMNARRIGHVLFDDFGDTCRRPEILEAQRSADGLLQGRLGTRFIKLDLAAGEIGGIDFAQRQIGIGDGGFGAAAAIADGAGGRAGAVRPDGDAVQFVDAGDGAAAGADFHHFDDRNAHRNAGALHVAVGAGDFEFAGAFRFAIGEQADLGGGAAHVEGEDFGQRAFGGDFGGEDGAARRA